MTNKRKLIQKILSYVLVATLASGATWFLADTVPNSKLERLADVIDRRFVGQADETAIQDAAADAMIRALGDRWSYYISAENYAKHKENQKTDRTAIQQTDSETLTAALMLSGTGVLRNHRGRPPHDGRAA